MSANNLILLTRPMSSLRLMQLITERLVRTFQDIHKAINQEVDRMKKDDRPLPLAEPAQSEQSPQSEKNKPSNLAENEEKERVEVEQREKVGEESPSRKQQKKSKRVSTWTRPKKPQNSFKMFLVQLKNQGSNKEDPQFVNEVTKIATKKWQSMSAEDKKPYQDMEQKEMEQYDRRLEEYYKENPEEKQKDLDKKELKEEKKKQKQEQKQKMKEKIKLRDHEKSEDPDGKQKKEKKEKPKSPENRKKPSKVETQKSKTEKVEQQKKVNFNKEESDIDDQIEDIAMMARDDENPVQVQRMSGLGHHQEEVIEQAIHRPEIDGYLNLNLDQVSDSLGSEF